MFEVDGFIGEPLGFGIITDIDVSPHKIPDESAVGVKEQASSEVSPHYNPVFSIILEFVNEDNAETKVAFNDFGVTYGRRILDDTLLIRFNVADAAAIGEGTWKVNVSVDELTAREHVLDGVGVVRIHNKEQDHVSKALSDSWFTKSVTGKNIIEDWDFAEKQKKFEGGSGRGRKRSADKKAVFDVTRNSRLQTCIDCEFFVSGMCTADEDNVKEVLKLVADPDAACPKGYWKEV